MIPLVIALFVLAGVLTYLGILYNGLVALRNNVDKAWANIDVLLKQRRDELPRLLDVCQGYMQYERETLTRVTEARAEFAAAATVAQKAQASSTVSMSLRQLFASAENYPQLQANQTFLRLQNRISELENEIADRREFYNDAINLFNTRIQQMPDSVAASLAAMRPLPMFRATLAEKAPVSVTIPR